MPITSWPRPCPIGIASNRLHTGRVYGKKTCGGYQCVKTWRQWNYEMQTKYTSLANMTIQERFEAEQLDAEIEALKAEERAQLPPEPEPQMPLTENEKANDYLARILKDHTGTRAMFNPDALTNPPIKKGT